MDQSLPSGARTLKAVERRSEVRFEGELQASFNFSDTGGEWVVPSSPLEGADADKLVSGYQVNAVPISSTA